MALAEFNRSDTRRDRRAVDPVSMRHNQAVAGAVVAAVLALSARRDLETLNVLATEDGIVSPKKGAMLNYGGGLVEDMFKRLPKSTRRVVIKGGNHASDAASEALRHRRDSMLRAGASATTASRRTTASGRSASRTSSPKPRATSSRSSSASRSAGNYMSVRPHRYAIVAATASSEGTLTVLAVVRDP